MTPSLDWPEQLLEWQRERSAGSLRLPDEPVSLDSRKSVSRGPDLYLPGIAVDDPVQRHPGLLVATTLGEAVVPWVGGAQHLGDQQQVANGAPLERPRLPHRHDEHIRLEQHIRSPGDVRGRGEG